MKNRFCILFITMLLILVMAGCKNTGESSPAPSDNSSPSTQSDASPMSTYKSVLQNKTQFFSTDAKKNLNISQLNQAVSDDDSVKVKAIKLAIADLENDEIPEVILWLDVNTNEYYGFEVLRYRDGVVYGYTLPYKSFMDLKDDGTFSFSSGTADSGFGKVKFTENGYSIDKITYSESSDNSGNNQITSYFVNNQSASEEDFLSAINKQSDKTAITWYDFTDENIEKLLSE